MIKNIRETAKAAADTPSVLYVGKFDIASMIMDVRKGLSPAQHIHAVSELEKHGWNLSWVDVNAYDKASKLDFYRTVIRSARTCGAVLAHSTHDVRLLAIMKILKLFNKPLLAFVHSIGDSKVNKIALRGFDKLLILTEASRNRLLAYGVPSEKIIYFQYGADSAFYKPRAQDTSHILSVGVCGRDFDTLLTAAAEVKYPFTMVGRLNDKQKAAAGANVMLHADGSYSLPFEELLVLYNTATMVVVTHHGTSHPFGINALVEAMAMGKAVILTSGPGIDIDPVKLGFGIAIPPHDPQALIKTINYLLANRETVLRMGRRARELVEKNFNTPNMGETILSAINSIEMGKGSLSK